ncbi:B-cell receptor CD22-like [Danio aesculapii]|uniref:B-cell receptor CD22-like n=1 Tax=Danio aesculapii TaxID=1142201 RepID=UPI0024C011E7|nr:B-cell receptor CD22-like [Danio aesculapii]
MMMSVRMAPPLPLLILLMIHRISCGDWGVSYSAPHCALKNSTVIMSCNYTYPTGHQIKNVFWTKEKDRKEKEDHPDLSEDPEYSQRLQYLGDKQRYYTIRLSQVTKKDEHQYFCRITTNQPGGKWIDVLGVTFNVTDLQLESPERVTEGDSVRLTCKSSCKLTDTPTFIWYRNSQLLTEGTIGNKLILDPVRREDLGRYRCAVHGHTLTSPEVYLNVMYPPKSVSVSVGGSAVMEGDSVTLSCSSDSNPPAQISWFKEGNIVGSGQIFSISKISSDDSEKYKCRGINEHGEKYSDPVTLDVQYPPRETFIVINRSAVIMSGDSVTLSCSSDSNPPAEINWFKGTQHIRFGRTFNISKISSDDSGEYKCRAKNEHGEKNSDPVTLDVQYPPKSVSVSISGSAVIMSGDSVTLSCSSDSNPPAEINWFNGETSVRSGRIFNISKISSDDSGEYKCKARNDHGGKYSDPVTLDVQYAPKSTSVSISGSAVIMEGDSVSLMCISDSNPPALNFSWFKENQSSAVGSGQSFSAVQSGRFYCEAHNPHGAQRSDAVTVTVRGVYHQLVM